MLEIDIEGNLQHVVMPEEIQLSWHTITGASIGPNQYGYWKKMDTC
jgi:hypothetical protein